MREDFDAREETQLESRLDACFAAYRDACPDPEPSADFMPQLWARIEGRRQAQAVVTWRRWAEGFLSLAAAVCLLIVLTQVVPQSAPTYYHSTYIDQLSEDDGPEHVLLQEVAQSDVVPPSPEDPAAGANSR